jgi:hypothetical protein
MYKPTRDGTNTNLNGASSLPSLQRYTRLLIFPSPCLAIKKILDNKDFILKIQDLYKRYLTPYYGKSTGDLDIKIQDFICL